jgi:hypothetical protein
MTIVSNTTTVPTNLGISCNDETLPNFINPKHPMKGENKKQKEMTQNWVRRQKPTIGAKKEEGGKVKYLIP